MNVVYKSAIVTVTGSESLLACLSCFPKSSRALLQFEPCLIAFPVWSIIVDGNNGFVSSIRAVQRHITKLCRELYRLIAALVECKACTRGRASWLPAATMRSCQQAFSVII